MTPTLTCTRHQWTAPDGETLPYSFWDAGLMPGLLPDQHPRAVVVAIHGLSGAALDFDPLGTHLARHRVVTFAPELRGQGNDPRPERRGDLARLEDWFADLRAFLALVRSRYPDEPLYLYGESMGAALLTRFLAQASGRDLPDGLILASPVVVVPGKPGWWQRTFFRFLLWARPTHRIDVRKFTQRDRDDDPSKWVTRDEAHRTWFASAPHKLDSYTVRFFQCLFDLIGGCLDAAPQVKVPVLIVYAANDVFIPPARVEEFFGRLGSHEKEFHFFPDSYHLLLHDHDRAQVLERIEEWLLRRIAQTTRPRTTEERLAL